MKAIDTLKSKKPVESDKTFHYIIIKRFSDVS